MRAARAAFGTTLARPLPHADPAELDDTTLWTAAFDGRDRLAIAALDRFN